MNTDRHSDRKTDRRTPIVRPRAAGQPGPDLTTLAILHRGMRGEVRRLAALAAEQGDVPFPAEREAALQRHLHHLLDEIHTHHSKEDTIVWPVIVASAGAAVDLTPLTDDHGAIDPYLDRIRATSGTVRARALADLRDLLDEHIAEEEAVIFPVVRRYVSAEDWKRTEKEVSKGAGPARLKWLLSFIVSYAEPAELDRLMKDAGPVMRILHRLTRPSYDRLQHAVYGA